MLDPCGKAYTLPPLHSNFQWTKMLVLPHFILWGRIDRKDLVHLAITEREVPGIENLVWHNAVAPYHGRLDVGAHVEAKRILQKLERLWPCSFLAKEYRRKVTNEL